MSVHDLSHEYARRRYAVVHENETDLDHVYEVIQIGDSPEPEEQDFLTQALTVTRALLPEGERELTAETTTPEEINRRFRTPPPPSTQ